MKYPRFCRMGWILLLPALLCTLFACRQEPEPAESVGTTAPNPTQSTTEPVTASISTTTAQTTTAATPSETTALTEAIPIAQPQFAINENGLIDRVTISTPEEWNDFAAAFNADRDSFAAEVDVEITALLSFEDIPFVSLGSEFSGTIHGPQDDTVFSEESLQFWLDVCRKYPEPETFFCLDFAVGFANIRTVSGGHQMFGEACGTLTLEYLGFYNIAYQVIDPPQYGPDDGMLCYSAENLSLNNVIFLACGDAGQYYDNHMLSLKTYDDALLAAAIQNLSLHKVIAQSCTVNSAGLFYEFVGRTLTVDGLYVVGCTNRSGVPYEYWPSSLLGDRVDGTATLENIVLLRSRANGLTGSAFGVIAQVEVLKNITIETCNFYCPVYTEFPFSGHSGILFPCFVGPSNTPFWLDRMDVDFEAETLKNTPLIENVTVSGTVTSLNPKYERDYDWYRALGITVENCLNLVD